MGSAAVLTDRIGESLKRSSNSLMGKTFVLLHQCSGANDIRMQDYGKLSQPRIAHWDALSIGLCGESLEIVPWEARGRE